MRLVTLEDILDIYIKFLQRGAGFITSKLNLKNDNRTKSSFNNIDHISSNWWIIPSVRKRWNTLITGDENVSYEQYLCNTHFKNIENIDIISIGSGVCSHELEIAKLQPSWNIDCFDFSEKLLSKAQNIAKENNIKNINFFAEDVKKYDFTGKKYDIIFFHASLHHFDRMEDFFLQSILPLIKDDGYLVINEFVGADRLQYSAKQIKAINQLLYSIPKKYRKIYKTNLYKNKYYGSGLLRMYISDPSECVDSSKINPNIRKYFNTEIEKPYGGNLLMSALKDISHHFITTDQDKEKVLQELFELEDKYIAEHTSDFVFGIYKVK